MTISSRDRYTWKKMVNITTINVVVTNMFFNGISRNFEASFEYYLCICAIFCLFQIWASLAFGRMGECKRLMSPHPYQVPQHQHIVPMLFFFYTVMMMVHGKHDYHCNRFIIIGRLRSFCFFAQLTYFFVLVAQSKTSQWAKRDRATWKWPCWSWRASSSSPSSPSPSSTMSSSSSPSSSTAAFATSTTISWWIVFVIRNRKSGMECM